jgi:Phosphoesterase family.
LPTVSFVVPNEQDDMHDGTVAMGDTWLSQNIEAYRVWATTHNSVLIVTWDEDDSSQNNQIPTIISGQNIRPGNYSESSIERAAGSRDRSFQYAADD